MLLSHENNICAVRTSLKKEKNPLFAGSCKLFDSCLNRHAFPAFFHAAKGLFNRVKIGAVRWQW